MNNELLSRYIQRLELLEYRYSKLRRLFLVLIATVPTLLFVLGQSSNNSKRERVIEAREFRIIDEDGKVHGTWKAAEKNSIVKKTYFELLDADGEERFQISLMKTTENSGLLSYSMKGSKTKAGSNWIVTPRGSSLFSMTDEKGDQRAFMGYFTAGDSFAMTGNPESPGSSLELTGENEKTIFKAP